MINAGKYKYKISIYQVIEGKDSQGFPSVQEKLILEPYANVKTTRGFTLIKNDSNFEKAYTNFTIRYSKTLENAYYNALNDVNSNRDMFILFRNKRYKIEYFNNIDEECVELELQAKEILK